MIITEATAPETDGVAAALSALVEAAAGSPLGYTPAELGEMLEEEVRRGRRPLPGPSGRDWEPEDHDLHAARAERRAVQRERSARSLGGANAEAPGHLAAAKRERETAEKHRKETARLRAARVEPTV